MSSNGHKNGNGLKPTAKVGRPSGYQDYLPERAFELCLLGATEAQIAAVFGVNIATITRWKQDHPEFRASLKAGRDAADGAVAKSLYSKALSGDTTACIFWLKNRRPDVWRDKFQHEHQQTANEAMDKLVAELSAEFKLDQETVRADLQKRRPELRLVKAG